MQNFDSSAKGEDAIDQNYRDQQQKRAASNHDDFIQKVVITGDSDDSVVRKVQFYSEYGGLMLEVGTESKVVRQVKREIVLKKGERLLGIEATH